MRLTFEAVRLRNKSYSITSKVLLRIFETFVDAHTGKGVNVTLDNYAELALLPKKFWFHRLDKDIVEVEKESETTKEVRRSVCDTETL